MSLYFLTNQPAGIPTIASRPSLNQFDKAVGGFTWFQGDEMVPLDSTWRVLMDAH